MRKLQWILHGEKDSLNALGEMKLVPLTLSEPSRRSLPIPCNNQISRMENSACVLTHEALWASSPLTGRRHCQEHLWSIWLRSQGRKALLPISTACRWTARSLGELSFATSPGQAQRSQLCVLAGGQEKYWPQKLEMLNTPAGEEARKGRHTKETGRD